MPQKHNSLEPAGLLQITNSLVERFDLLKGALLGLGESPATLK